MHAASSVYVMSSTTYNVIEDVLEGRVVACAKNHFDISNVGDKVAVAETIPFHDKTECFAAEMNKVVDQLISPLFWNI